MYFLLDRLAEANTAQCLPPVKLHCSMLAEGKSQSYSLVLPDTDHGNRRHQVGNQQLLQEEPPRQVDEPGSDTGGQPGGHGGVRGT